MPTWTLNVSDPANDFDDDAPACLAPPGDRWCSLWGPRGPCRPSVEGTAQEWLLIAGAIEAGAPRAFKRVGFEPLPADGGHLWSPRNTTGLADHVTLTAADLLDLAKSIRDQLAPAVPAPGSRPPGVPTSAIADQPPPVPSDRPAIWPLVIADMHERDQLGRARYGTPLQAHNGRDPLVDAYQELLDGAVYLRQAIEERASTPVPADRIARARRDGEGHGFEAGWRARVDAVHRGHGDLASALAEAKAEYMASGPPDLATGLRDLAARWRQGSADGDDRTAADCAGELEALLAGGGQ